MQKEAVFTLKLEPELREAFKAEAEAAHRPASQIVREMMREFIQHQQENRAYDDFLKRKVEVAQVSAQAGQGRANEDVEADFAKRRKALLGRVDKAGT